jgi:hypothetical protein
MRRIVRENAACALVALAACALLGYLGLEDFLWNDYETEAQPAFTALVHGHVAEFLRLAPAYGGSLIERAPFALLPGLWGGGALAVYRAVAAPCLLAAAALGVYLVARMRTERRPKLARALALVVCVANPITLQALEVGHPDELLGACMCVAAVLLAANERPWWAGFVLGLAIANKEWALLAAGPTLLALSPRRRVACGALAIAVACVVLAPLVLVGSGGFVAATRATASPGSAIFQPWQLWWFLGHHGALVHGAFGQPKPGYRIGPAWTGTISHPLVLLAGLAVALAVWRRERRGGPTCERDALLALAFVLLLRCVLDTWDTAYYLLPFLLALLAWDATGARTRAPVVAVAATALATIGAEWLAQYASPDVQAAFFLAWTLPLCAWLGLRLLAPARLARPRSPLAPPARAQETTVSALSRPVRIS